MIEVRFGTWYPLEEASAHAPAQPGVFQIRIDSGLIQYPKGKSAMIHYAAADNLRAAATAFADAHAGSNWLCRHTIKLSADSAQDLQPLCARLVDRFSRSFGSPPRLP